MSISPVSASIPSAVQANLAAKATPHRRDHDGDHASNAAETKPSEASKAGQLLNIKA